MSIVNNIDRSESAKHTLLVGEVLQASVLTGAGAGLHLDWNI